MNSDAICSCGSGKQYKFCCGKAPATVSMKAAFTWFIIGLLVSGIAAIAWFMPGDKSDSPAASIPVINNAAQSTFGAGSNPNILNPKPWQYDPIKDQYWHTSSGNPHWHRGKPPINPGQ